VSVGTIDELAGWALELVSAARVARLGLVDANGNPRVLPVSYAHHADALWSVVDQKPKRQAGELARLRWLRRHPRAALTVDHYSEDWGDLAWVQALGPVAILPPSEYPEAVRVLTARYPQYESDPPPGPLLRLTPDRILFWRAAEPG